MAKEQGYTCQSEQQKTKSTSDMCRSTHWRQLRSTSNWRQRRTFAGTCKTHTTSGQWQHACSQRNIASKVPAKVNAGRRNGERQIMNPPKKTKETDRPSMSGATVPGNMDVVEKEEMQFSVPSLSLRKKNTQSNTRQQQNKPVAFP